VSDRADPERAHLAFAFAVQSALSPIGNSCFSPFSMASALGFASHFARGDTASELRLLLLGNESKARSKFQFEADFLEQLRHLQSASELRSKLSENEPGESPTLAVSNTLWLWDGLQLNQGFSEILANWPGSSVEIAPFVDDPEEARRRINADVASTTRDLIPELISPGGIESNTVASIVNALYLKAGWLSPFSSSRTEEADFFTPSGKRRVATMHQSERLGYAAQDDWQLVALPAAGGLEALILLPGGKLADQESTMDVSLLGDLLAAKQDVQVRLSIPKLELDVRTDLGEVLRDLGVRTMFSPHADFSGLSDDPRIYVSDVVHQAVLKVDEKGFEGAAAIGMSIALMGWEEPVVVQVDRPFLFLVRHVETGVVYFYARVVEP